MNYYINCVGRREAHMWSWWVECGTIKASSLSSAEKIKGWCVKQNNFFKRSIWTQNETERFWTVRNLVQEQTHVTESVCVYVKGYKYIRGDLKTRKVTFSINMIFMLIWCETFIFKETAWFARVFKFFFRSFQHWKHRHKTFFFSTMKKWSIEFVLG